MSGDGITAQEARLLSEASIETLKGEFLKRRNSPRIVRGGFDELEAAITLAEDHDRLLRIIEHQRGLLDASQRYIMLAQGCLLYTSDAADE